MCLVSEKKFTDIVSENILRLKNDLKKSIVKICVVHETGHQENKWICRFIVSLSLNVLSLNFEICHI